MYFSLGKWVRESTELLVKVTQLQRSPLMSQRVYDLEFLTHMKSRTDAPVQWLALFQEAPQECRLVYQAFIIVTGEFLVCYTCLLLAC